MVSPSPTHAKKGINIPSSHLQGMQLKTYKENHLEHSILAPQLKLQCAYHKSHNGVVLCVLEPEVLDFRWRFRLFY